MRLALLPSPTRYAMGHSLRIRVDLSSRQAMPRATASRPTNGNPIWRQPPVAHLPG